MSHDPISILGSLLALVVISEWLVRHTVLRVLGTALLVIVLTAIAANTGLFRTTRAACRSTTRSSATSLGLWWCACCDADAARRRYCACSSARIAARSAP